MLKVLIVDDDVAVTNYLMVFLAQTDEYESTVLNDSREVQELLERETFDILLLDMDMPYLSGMDILSMTKDMKSLVPVVFLTGVGDVDLAVKAMKLGAFDYLSKPVDEEHLLDVLANAVKYSSTQESIRSLPVNPVRSNLAFQDAFEQLPSLDPEMIKILHKAEKMAHSDLPIFIWGEIGTMKELLAGAIHQISPRCSSPFVLVDVAEISPKTFPMEFFGTDKDWSGSHTEHIGFLEAAEGGTLFIDNIDRLSPPMQTRLKRVIQTGDFYREKSTSVHEANVRFIVASHFDLTSDEYKGRFSDDLLYHLMIYSIYIPPLRERPDDIPLLADMILKEETARAGKRVTGFDGEFITLLKSYDFPYNRSELKNILSKAIISSDSDILTIENVPEYVLERIRIKQESAEKADKPKRLLDIEKEHIKNALDYYEGDRIKTAEELGIDLDKLDEIVS